MLPPELKSLLWKTAIYAAIGLFGVGVGRLIPNDPALHPAALEALNEIPPRVILIENDIEEGTRILLDQKTGKQILFYRGAMVVLPEPEAITLEDLTNPFGQ